MQVRGDVYCIRKELVVLPSAESGPSGFFTHRDGEGEYFFYCGLSRKGKADN